MNTMYRGGNWELFRSNLFSDLKNAPMELRFLTLIGAFIVLLQYANAQTGPSFVADIAVTNDPLVKGTLIGKLYYQSETQNLRINWDFANSIEIIDANDVCDDIILHLTILEY
jgi:hypothetical protein